jgi:hypothetical protein
MSPVQRKKPMTRAGEVIASFLNVIEDVAIQLERFNSVLFRLYLQVTAIAVTIGLFVAFGYEIATRVHR